MRYFPRLNLASGAAALCLLTSCFTPAKEKQLRGDIFNLQTRLLQLETNVSEGKQTLQTADASSKRLASTNAEMERLQQDIKKINGEIDALKVGVSTGQMPGQAEPQDGSIAGQLAAITQRLELIEAAQEELIANADKSGKKNPAKKNAKGELAKDAKDDKQPVPGGITNIEQLQQAFDKKRYKYVAIDAPAVIKKSKGKDKELAIFLNAESMFKLGKIREAALQYNEFLDLKPEKKYVPTAKMRLGDCFRHLGDKSTAKIYYEELVREYPETPEGQKAKERLASSGTSGTSGH